MRGIGWCLVFLLVLNKPSWTQEFNPQVKEIIDQINIDSLVSFVRILTGEDSIQLYSAPTLIRHRTNVLESGNESAAEYLKQKLQDYGMQIADQSYSDDGRNIIATQSGTDYADQIVLICAHYDAVDYYCADDNASGVAAVLEASRILSGYQFKQTIVYALWDEEEIGLLGSGAYADQAYLDSLDIRGVINLDMIGWDENNDGLMEIHTRDVASSPQLADLVSSMKEVYDLSLNCEVTNPGTSASDHSAFWRSNYSAVLIIEAYFGGDFNPYYHSSEDRIDKFNLLYFKEMSRLAIGALSTLALADPGWTTANRAFRSGDWLSVYPNPAQHFAYVQSELHRKQKVVVTIYNSLGNLVLEPIVVSHEAGKHTLEIEVEDLTNGLYYVVIETSEKSISHKLIVLR